MDETTITQFDELSFVIADAPHYFDGSECDNRTLTQHGQGKHKQLTLNEVKNILRHEPVIFAHLMNGTSPFGHDCPLSASWRSDGEQLARQVLHGINTLNDDENGLTLVIACAGAYQQGRMDHLMIWNISTAGDTVKLQVGNQESIGGQHYPTELVNTVELWQQYDPDGAKNCNTPGMPVKCFADTPVGISVAHHGLFINLFPASASQNFERALTALRAEEAGQRFGYFDEQKSCFTTARDLLGAIRTKGPHRMEVDWDARCPQPVMPVIFNKLSLLTNHKQVGIESALGKSWDLNDRTTRQEVNRDKAAFAALASQLGRWINKKPGAYQVNIRPALPCLS